MKPYGQTPQGDRVFLARRAMGWSHEELGRRSGLGRLQVLRVEQGTNQATSYAVRAGLARGFGVPTAFFVEYLEGAVPLEVFKTRCNSTPSENVVRDAGPDTARDRKWIAAALRQLAIAPERADEVARSLKFSSATPPEKVLVAALQAARATHEEEEPDDESSAPRRTRRARAPKPH
ncbi:MAG: helix-turn-helix domain-containing protein [Pseudomonadota bacterium]|nr:MAG: hypothetical protein DIU78_07315 [Pseudomonadota bacterium]